MKNSVMIDKLMNSPKIRNLGIKREALSGIIESYHNVLLQSLLEQGNIDVGNGMIIEIVKLLDRIHVLRGVSYKSSRKYKLKLTMEESLYKKIEEYYDKLGEEIK